MTSSSEQPPKEYIITEDRVVHIAKIFAVHNVFRWEDVIDQIRSRPHPAPAQCPMDDPIKCKHVKFMMMACHKENIEQIRKAREDAHKMCNKRIANIRYAVMDNSKKMNQECYELIMNSIDEVEYRIKSLSTTTPQSEQEQPR